MSYNRHFEQVYFPYMVCLLTLYHVSRLKEYSHINFSQVEFLSEILTVLVCLSGHVYLLKLFKQLTELNRPTMLELVEYFIQLW